MHLKASIDLSFVKDRHQWLGREFRGSLSLNMDKLLCLKLLIKALVFVLLYIEDGN